MAARQTKTPGATTPTPEETKQPDLDAVLGKQETPEIKDPETSTPTPEEYAAFLAWRNSQATTEPVTQHVGASESNAPKRTRQVCGKDGWTTEEY